MLMLEDNRDLLARARSEPGNAQNMEMAISCISTEVSDFMRTRLKSHLLPQECLDAKPVIDVKHMPGKEGLFYVIFAKRNGVGGPYCEKAELEGRTEIEQELAGYFDSRREWISGMHVEILTEHYRFNWKKENL
jgi:hypothetical protein